MTEQRQRALLLLLWFNLIPFFNRGSEFEVHPDGSVTVRRNGSAEFLGRLLARRGFSIEGPATGDSFTARRT